MTKITSIVDIDIIWDICNTILPDEVIEAMDLEVDDTILWIDNKDGTFTLKKKEKIDE
ncbi:hypothetical protein UFOVP245_162 [uncultured Caudovirales phage]|uniref:Uncharacterized protein n=1 Tax=uncultured Caudovirales phage TaxID=2100421 RepID=A0A6J7WX70_9CAUD|nr:hypothetical protein UFOVP245_162 [uncultured Caudovirales phage]